MPRVRWFGELWPLELDAVRRHLIQLHWMQAGDPMPDEWDCEECGRRGLLLEELLFVDADGDLTPLCPAAMGRPGHRAPGKEGWAARGPDAWTTVRPSGPGRRR